MSRPRNTILDTRREFHREVSYEIIFIIDGPRRWLTRKTRFHLETTFLALPQFSVNVGLNYLQLLNVFCIATIKFAGVSSSCHSPSTVTTLVTGTSNLLRPLIAQSSSPPIRTIPKIGP